MNFAKVFFLTLALILGAGQILAQDAGVYVATTGVVYRTVYDSARNDIDFRLFAEVEDVTQILLAEDNDRWDNYVYFNSLSGHVTCASEYLRTDGRTSGMSTWRVHPGSLRAGNRNGFTMVIPSDGEAFRATTSSLGRVSTEPIDVGSKNKYCIQVADALPSGFSFCLSSKYEVGNLFVVTKPLFTHSDREWSQNPVLPGQRVIAITPSGQNDNKVYVLTAKEERCVPVAPGLGTACALLRPGQLLEIWVGKDNEPHENILWSGLDTVWDTRFQQVSASKTGVYYVVKREKEIGQVLMFYDFKTRTPKPTTLVSTFGSITAVLAPK